MDREQEVRRLNEADRHIANGERAVSKQLAILKKLGDDGHDTAEAARQLRDFEATLATLREHRAIIVKMIDQIDSDLA